uniref:Uncharacterized protein n=1 Tax=Brassica campestris TaxID=3711 RepID=M4F0B2_BRACM
MAVTARSDYSGASRQSVTARTEVTPVILEHSRDLIMNPDEERFSRMSAHPMADAEEIIEMAGKATLSEQQKQVQGEVTDENREAAQEAKGKAMEALSEGNFDEAIEHPTSAILYGNSGEY